MVKYMQFFITVITVSISVAYLIFLTHGVFTMYASAMSGMLVYDVFYGLVCLRRKNDYKRY